jgi:hypothetical protein
VRCEESDFTWLYCGGLSDCSPFARPPLTLPHIASLRSRLRSSPLFGLSLRGGALAAVVSAPSDGSRGSSVLAAAAAAAAAGDGVCAESPAAVDEVRAQQGRPYPAAPAVASWPWKTEQGLLTSSLDHRDYR